MTRQGQSQERVSIEKSNQGLKLSEFVVALLPIEIGVVKDVRSTAQQPVLDIARLTTGEAAANDEDSGVRGPVRVPDLVDAGLQNGIAGPERLVGIPVGKLSGG